MDFTNSNNNNSNSRKNDLPPGLPEKSSSDSTDSLRTQNGLRRMSSHDHITPKAWKAQEVQHASTKKDLIHSLAKPETSNFYKPKQWRPAPRPLIKQKTVELETKEKQKDSKDNHPVSKSCHVDSTGVSKKKLQNPSSNLSDVTSDSLLLNSKAQNHQFQSRPSYRKDPKSPSVGTLKRMWDEKSNSINTAGKPPQSNKGVKGAHHFKKQDSWQHVRVSQKSRTNSLLENNQAISIDCLSPKPFRSVTHSGDIPVIFPKSATPTFDYSDKSVNNIESKSSNKTQNPETKVGADNLNAEEEIKDDAPSDNTNLSLNDSHSETSELPNALENLELSQGSEVGVYVDLDENQAKETISKLQPVSKKRTTKSTVEFDGNKPPPVPPHDPVPLSYLDTVSSSNESVEVPNYLPMDGSSSVIEDTQYVGMTSDSETLEADYVDTVIVPPPALQHYSKSHREYVDIDSKVPSPPDREPPNLPPERPESINRDSSFEDPPPLPPANSVGRRSMSYGLDQKIEVLQSLDEKLSKKDAKTSKILKYVEVDVGMYQPSPRDFPKQQPTKYTEVTVSASDGKGLPTERRTSGANEEESSTVESKKSMNVKQMIQSLFSKDEPKSAQENLTDFDKERNKRKRISGRFMRKKTKDGIKVQIKKEAISSPSTSRFYDVATNPAQEVVSNPRLSSDINPPQRPVSSNSSASLNSSGDGEVGRTGIYIVNPSTTPNSHPKAKARVLPTKSNDSTSINDAATFKPSPPTNSKQNHRSNRSSADRSTFIAYPAQHQANSNTEKKPAVSSFLYGDSSSKLSSESSSPASRRSQIPPPVPPHSKRTSTLAEESSTSRLSGIPLPGLVSEKHQSPQKSSSDGSTPLPQYQPSNTDTDSVVIDTDGDYLDFRDSRASLNEGLYIAAEDIPPPENDASDSPPQLPERDDSGDEIYESIEASHVVPPTPSIKEEPYSFLLSEPLYQVYRRRTMSHASSKRREELREKAHSEPEKSAEWESELMSEDLGTSTLWRSLPLVEHSGLSVDMTSQQLKLQQSQFEVITSEASYLRSLNILYNHFMNDSAMLSSDILPAADRRHLFSNIETVRTVEQKLLRDLEEHFFADIKLSRVCDSVARYAKSDFKVYILYIQNQVYQDRVLTRLQRTHDRFSVELSRLESSPACNKLSLLSFLLLPMQRVTRLPLLLSAVVNAADAADDTDIHKKAKHALGVVNKLVKTCNESARKMQQTEQLAEIAAQLEYSSSVKMFALISQSRSLIKKGEMNISMTTDPKKAPKTSKLWLFLFTDVLFVAKKKSVIEFNASPRYEVIDWAGRQYLAVNEHAVTENAIYLVVLENQAGKRVEMSLMPSTQNEMSRWETALNPPHYGPAGESIYEQWDCPQYTCIYQYEAQQPDELSLQNGDVMQVLKKTSDGWLEGERLRDGESGWFPANYCEEIEDEHVRSRNMKNRFRAS